MKNQLTLREEIKARSSALYELTIDDAKTEAIVIAHSEAELECIEEEINSLANLGFFGYDQPGGLTQLFYGYAHQKSVPGHHPGAGSPSQA